MEIFDMQVTSYYELIMSAFVRTVIKPLIQYNFDPLLYPDAEESGSFSINPTRPEEIKDTTDMIDKLAEKGFLSPGNEEHRQWVSKVLGFPYVPFKESEVLNTVRKDTPAPTPSPAPRATQSQQSNDRT
jgi:phage gp29-like protein